MNLNKREKFLYQKLNLLKTKVISMDYRNFSENEKRKNIILPFLQITGYDLSDKEIFAVSKKKDKFSADYCILKESKPAIYVKYIEIDDKTFDFKNNIYYGNKELSETAENLLKDSQDGYVVLTNGLIYLFFTSKDLNEEIEYSDKCFFYFNLLNTEEVETEIGLLNSFFTKESVFNYLDNKKIKYFVLLYRGILAVFILFLIFLVLKFYGTI